MASNNVDTAAATAGAASSSRGEGRSTELSHGHNPVTVSSLSSIDTAGYDYNDASLNNTNDLYNNDQQQSANPHPLPPIPSNSITANDQSLPLSQSYMNPDTSLSQQQSLPSQLTSSSGPLMGQTTMRLSPTTRVVVPSAPTVNTVPEFLCSLTKMLTDNNREIIEWSNGKIEVHNPHKLETHVLNRYFRHSKFASFQRQLNYFGFRKLAGKGKMAPCSYVNDSTTNELGSLLLVKRKQGNEPKGKNPKKRERDSASSASTMAMSATTRTASFPGGQVPPGSDTHLNQGNNGISNITVNQSQKALARVAVGKGVRHGFVPNKSKTAAPRGHSTHSKPSVVAPSPVQASLNALTNNYRNSLNELQNADQQGISSTTHNTATYSTNGDQSGTSSLAYVPGSLRRDDSLVDLAMIPLAEDGADIGTAADSSGFSFVDFPFDPDFLSNEDVDGS